LTYFTVGGGTAGAVLAGRLSEDKTKTILVIEAGGDPASNPNIDIPLMADSIRGTDFDWQYRTVPQKHACQSSIDKVTSRSSEWPKLTKLVCWTDFTCAS